MITGTCVCTNGRFTLFNEYELHFGYDDFHDKVFVRADDGWLWIVEPQEDDYYGCTDIDGKQVSFLVYE
jgi:hypothetical protein